MQNVCVRKGSNLAGHDSRQKPNKILGAKQVGGKSSTIFWPVLFDIGDPRLFVRTIHLGETKLTLGARVSEEHELDVTSTLMTKGKASTK